MDPVIRMTLETAWATARSELHELDQSLPRLKDARDDAARRLARAEDHRSVLLHRIEVIKREINAAAGEAAKE